MEDVPKIGDLSIITDFDGVAKCIIENKNVTVKTFSDVTKEFAFREGEGDKSLNYWRKVHIEFFTRELKEVNKEFTEDMKVVCEEFEVIFKNELNMRYEKSCGAVVFRKINNIIEYLILKSIGPDSYWGFPKGHVERGETEEETCIREVLEETNIRIIPEINFRITNKYKIGQEVEKEVILFLGNAQSQQVKIQEEEIEEYKWLGFNEAIELLTFKSNRKILIESNKFLIKK